MDTQLVEKIVHEVKSQGVFDEFRKDSMADVDTKPAYQNLRQRVENTVKRFLGDQKWTPDTNKNQLREKLRRHITESGFLDVGVERIVDQVVNPKIGSVFQPRIEEIAYKYLGLPMPPKKLEPPPPPLMHPLPPLPLNAPPLKVETCSLLPTDLEQVSPDSDKGTVKSEGGDDRTTVDMDTDDKVMDDEYESPPFEPVIKNELQEPKEELKIEKKEEKANIKNECDTSVDEKKQKIGESDLSVSVTVVKTENLGNDNDSQELSNFAIESADVDKETSHSVDARISQDSQLSSVSSDSRLSINGKEDYLQSSSQEAVAANISEEAQMPKFNENSCEPNAPNNNACEKVLPKSELHFDIKKDEIKFEGTERKSGLESEETPPMKSEEDRYISTEEIPTVEANNDPFKFSTNNSNAETKEDDSERTPNAQDLSFGSSIEDSSSVPNNHTPKASSQIKEKDDSPKVQLSKQPIPTTPTTTPIPTTPLCTPTATPSPITSHKSDKDHQSRHSSSSSKQKKHSKERHKSHERDKERDSRDRHRSSKESTKDCKYHSSGSNKSRKHSTSSSSSKYSSSHNKSVSEKDLEKTCSSSTHSSSKHVKHSHSHSSSSSNENHDSKKSKRDSDRKHSSSSSSKRNDKKDDHGEVKHKSQRRKSTDSNDDDGDKSVGGGKTLSHKSSYSSLSTSKSSKSKSSGDVNKSPTSKTNEPQKYQMDIDNDEHKSYVCNNVVILNDILENPNTQFIQLNNTGHLVETPEQQLTTIDLHKKSVDVSEFNNKLDQFASKAENEKCMPNDSMDLLYFEEIHTNLSERLKLLNYTMDLCRSAVNSLRFDSLSDEGIVLSNEEDGNNSDNKPNLLTETLKRKSNFDYVEYQKTPCKRKASNESEECDSKTSPTPSDSSANSKENEEIPKNIDHAKKSLVDRDKAVQKLTQQQRYSSEDLYKPRPILGQRSRRRGMDSLI